MKSKKTEKTDSKIALLAGKLKRQTSSLREEAVQASPRTVEPWGEQEYKQTVLRVSEALLTHTNMLSTELAEKVQQAAKNIGLRVSPNRALLVALLRWERVTQEDSEQILIHGKESDPKKQSMWLPRTDTVHRRLQLLQKQFVQRGVLIAKTGANEPAIARQALWRWDKIMDEDVAFYRKTFL